MSACLPYEIDYESILTEEGKKELLSGKIVKKVDYQERFERKILAVIVPLLDEKQLEGIIYLYVPLARISELTEDFSYMWLIAGILFLSISIYIGTHLVKKLTKPLLEIKAAAKRFRSVTIRQGFIHRQMMKSANWHPLLTKWHLRCKGKTSGTKEFLASISHELRTPISYINGYSEALLTGIVKSEEEQKKYLALIIRESERMNRLVGIYWICPAWIWKITK